MDANVILLLPHYFQVVPHHMHLHSIVKNILSTPTLGSITYGIYFSLVSGSK